MRHASLLRASGGVLAALLAVGARAESTATERFDADLTSSHVTVEGTSTLHNWKVEGQSVKGYLSIDEQELAALWMRSGPSPHPLAATVRVEIPVISLTSGKRGMDEKMHEALRAKMYPTITYRLESAKIATRQTTHPGDDAGETRTINAKGFLTMAGVEQLIDIPMQVRRLPENRLEISGDISLRMTEFGIDPPRAMLGTLRTGDTVHVQWTWVLARGRIDNRDVP